MDLEIFFELRKSVLPWAFLFAQKPPFPFFLFFVKSPKTRAVQTVRKISLGSVKFSFLKIIFSTGAAKTLISQGLFFMKRPFFLFFDKSPKTPEYPFARRIFWKACPKKFCLKYFSNGAINSICEIFFQEYFFLTSQSV